MDIVLFSYHSVLLFECLKYCIDIHHSSVQGGLIEVTGGRWGPFISFGMYNIWPDFEASSIYGLIHTVENVSLIAAISDLSVAATRDSVAGHENGPRGFLWQN